MDPKIRHCFFLFDNQFSRGGFSFFSDANHIDTSGQRRYIELIPPEVGLQYGGPKNIEYRISIDVA